MVDSGEVVRFVKVEFSRARRLEIPVEALEYRGLHRARRLLARITCPSHVVAHRFAAQGLGKYLRELPFATISRRARQP